MGSGCWPSAAGITILKRKDKQIELAEMLCSVTELSPGTRADGMPVNISCILQVAGCTREQLTEAQAFPMFWVDCCTGKRLVLGMHGRLVLSCAGKSATWAASASGLRQFASVCHHTGTPGLQLPSGPGSKPVTPYHTTATLAWCCCLQVRLILSGFGEWRYLDCVSIRAGKQEALEYVRQLFSVPVDRCMAAGDSGNDTLMLAGGLRLVNGAVAP